MRAAARLGVMCGALAAVVSSRAEATCSARAVRLDVERHQLKADLGGTSSLEIDFVDVEGVHPYDCEGHWLVWYEPSPSGGYLHAANLDTGARKTLFEAPGEFATSHDGRYVAVTDEVSVRVIEIESMRVAEVYPTTTAFRTTVGPVQAMPRQPNGRDAPSTLIWTTRNKLFFGDTTVGSWWKLGTWSPGSHRYQSLDWLPFRGCNGYWLSPDGELAIYDNLQFLYVSDPSDPPRDMILTAIDLTTHATVQLARRTEVAVKVNWGLGGAVDLAVGDQAISFQSGELRARLNRREPADGGRN